MFSASTCIGRIIFNNLTGRFDEYFKVEQTILIDRNVVDRMAFLTFYMLSDDLYYVVILTIHFTYVKMCLTLNYSQVLVFLSFSGYLIND